MVKIMKARTPILVLILFVFAVGYTVAATSKVIVIPLGAKAATTIVAFSEGDQFLTLGVVDQVVRSVRINATGKGKILANASSAIAGFFTPAGTRVVGRCSITKNSTSIDTSALLVAGGDNLSSTPLSVTRGFNVSAAGLITINFVCDTTSTRVGYVYDSSLTATFTPSP